MGIPLAFVVIARVGGCPLLQISCMRYCRYYVNISYRALLTRDIWAGP